MYHIQSCASNRIQDPYTGKGQGSQEKGQGSEEKHLQGLCELGDMVGDVVKGMFRHSSDHMGQKTEGCINRHALLKNWLVMLRPCEEAL